MVYSSHCKEMPANSCEDFLILMRRQENSSETCFILHYKYKVNYFISIKKFIYKKMFKNKKIFILITMI